MEDLAVRIVLLVGMLVAGIMLVWLARATASGRVGRNQFAGIRTPRTLASDEAWLAAHRRAERPTVIAGIAAIASGVFAILPVPTTVAVGGALLGCAVMLVLVLYGAVVGRNAAGRASGRPAR